jgi:hypothetical protein
MLEVSHQGQQLLDVVHLTGGELQVLLRYLLGLVPGPLRER